MLIALAFFCLTRDDRAADASKKVSKNGYFRPVEHCKETKNIDVAFETLRENGRQLSGMLNSMRQARSNG
jgi:hypothetical protein